MSNRHQLRFRLILVAALLVGIQVLFELGRAHYLLGGNDAVNIADHAFYSVRMYGDLSIPASLNEINNLAVTLIYAGLTRLTGVPLDRFAFLVNIPLLLLAYAVLERAHVLLTGRLLGWPYALGLLPLAAYVPLINKDAFSVLFHILLVASFLRPRAGSVGAVVALAPVRVQHLGMLAIGLLLAIPRLAPSVRAGLAVFLYIVLSMVAGYVSSAELVFSATSATGTALGINAIVRELNDFGFLGSALLNLTIPIRHAFDLVRSVDFDGSPLNSVVMLGRIYLVLTLVANLKGVFLLIYCAPVFSNRRGLYLTSVVVCSFFLVWMVSPIVHYRYFLDLAPVLLLGLSVLSVERPAPPGREQRQG